MSKEWRRRTLWHLPHWRYDWARDRWISQDTGTICFVRGGKLEFLYSDWLD